jgi:hypothetical protein
MIWRIQFQSQGMIWVAMAALAIVLLVMWRVYRPELRLVSGPLRWILPATRTAALLALAMSLLRPAIQVPVGAAARPNDAMVAVLVDQSRSMSVVDVARTPAQLVQLAAALGELTEAKRPSSLTALRQRLQDLLPLVEQDSRARGELEYARLSGRAIDSASLHLHETRTALDTGVRSVTDAAKATPFQSEIVRIPGDAAAARIEAIIERIMQAQDQADEALYQSDEAVRSLCTELAALPRIELARRALEGRNGLIAALGGANSVRVLGFAGTIGSALQPESRLEADGNASDPAAALRDLPRRLDRSARIAGVLLLSDGRRVSPLATGASAGLPVDVPIIAVNCSSPTTKDLSIQSVSLPSAVYAGEAFSPSVSLTATGYNGAVARVVLDADGLRQESFVRIDADTAHVRFMPVRLSNCGFQRIGISVAPMDGEATTANNHAERVVKVVAGKIRVGLLGGLVSRDYQQFRSSASHFAGIILTEQMIAPAGKCELSPDAILEQDVLILSDVPVTALSADQWVAVQRLLNERGGSVIMMAGDPSIAAAYASNPLAASLLPWRGETTPAWRDWPGEDAVFRIVPAGSNATDGLKLSSDADLNRSLWNQLPPVFRLLSLPPLRSNVQPVLVERDSKLAVLTQARVGVGRVFFLGTNELWRWQAIAAGSDESSSDSVDADRIWLRIITNAARQPYAVSDAALALDVDRGQLEPGESLNVRATLGTHDLESLEPVVVRIEHGNANPQMLQLRTVPTRPGEYTATISGLAEGENTLRLIAHEHEVSLTVQVASSDEQEMRDVSGDANSLQNIVGPQGQVLNLSDLPSVPRRLAELQDATRPKFAEVRLWDSPYLFLFVLGCLGLEWGLRKRGGLS